MKRWWEQLKPVERRVVTIIGVVIFILLNYFFVVPHFGDWRRDEFRIARATATNDLYRAEIRHTEEYKRKVHELESSGEEVLPEDQAIDFVRFLNHVLANSIIVNSQSSLQTKTNDYSVDQQISLSLQATETNLVNFLYSMSEGNSMVRVRSMSLHPAQGQMQLGASITLVTSYQRKTAMPRGTNAPATTTRTGPAVTAPAPAPVVKTPPPAIAPPAVPNKRAFCRQEAQIIMRYRRRYKCPRINSLLHHRDDYENHNPHNRPDVRLYHVAGAGTAAQPRRRRRCQPC